MSGLGFAGSRKGTQAKNLDTGRSQECGAGLSTEDLRKPGESLAELMKGISLFEVSQVGLEEVITSK